MKRVTWQLCVVMVVVIGVLSLPTRAVAQGDAGTKTPRERLGWPSDAVEALFWRAMKLVKVAFWVSIICHLLLAFWVFKDSAGRSGGRWVFVALALLAGFCGAIVYALVRIGDRKT